MAPDGERTRLGTLLREFREKDGLSLRDVARRAGLNSGYLSQLERNEVAQPTPAVLHKVSLGYGLSFPQLMQWAGYIEENADRLSPNQALALRVLGDPTDEEVQALKQIISVLRANGRAPMIRSGYRNDRPLEPSTQTLIRNHARALLKEIGHLGNPPTSLGVAQQVIGLVVAGELTLSVEDRQSLIKGFGSWVVRAWENLVGSVDFRSNEIWIKPNQHPKRERFVRAHEIGHALLPWQRETFAYLDSTHTLSHEVAASFEREANEAAVEILFQGDHLRERADDSPISLQAITRLSSVFDASIVATARRVAEESKQECAVAIAYGGGAGYGHLGPTHRYCSDAFERRFHWSDGRVDAEIRNVLRQACSFEQSGDYNIPDCAGDTQRVRIDSLHNGYSAIAVFARDPRRKVLRRVRSASAVQ